MTEKIRLRPITFWLPIALFLSLVAASMVAPAAFLQTVTAINDWILRVFGGFFALAAFLFVLTCLAVFISPLGKLRLGGPDAKPVLSRWDWFAITLSTTIAIGILFWATAEPIYHIYDPGGTTSGIEAGGAAASQFAMTSLYMHWAITPYAIYTVPALTFALAYHNFHQPFSLSAPISAIRGKPLPKNAAQILDAICLTSLLFGLAASLGAGILSIGGGIDRISPLETGPVLIGLIAVGIVAAFTASSISGLQKGIRILSDINTKVFVVVAIFVIAVGPTLEILVLGGRGLAGYVTEFVPRSLSLGGYGDADWINAWTVFYFANWMAWAPLSAMFLGRIAQGYTVRAFITMNLFLPSLFAIVWMTIFGGFAIETEAAQPGILKAVLDEGGPEFVLYRLVEEMPLALGVAALFVALSFLSYVTAADSNTDVLSRLSVEGEVEGEKAAHKVWIKLIWGSLVGAAAWIMVSASGIDGIRMLSNLGGLPALFVLSAFAVILWMMLWRMLKRETLTTANQGTAR